MVQQSRIRLLLEAEETVFNAHLTRSQYPWISRNFRLRDQTAFNYLLIPLKYNAAV